MKETLRIAVAEDEPSLLRDLEEMLVELGHQVVAKAASGQELVEQCRALHPDLVISDIKMPGLDGLEAAQELRRTEPVPVVLVSAHSDADLMERALESHVLAYLVKPITADQLKAAIVLAMRRFREFRALRQEADDLRQALQDRKVIERAKGLLMKEANLDEEEAFRRLQMMARSKNLRLAQCADLLLTVREACQPDKKD